MPEYGSLFVCLMGMGTVFFGLICLIVLTTIMGKIVGGRPAPAAPAPVAAAPAAQEGNRQEIAAAVSAAIAEELGTSITGIRIVSMKKL
ncbi:OadG family protein [Oscillibacter sp.]|jgi:sodium pump decarboxylase gamma subunit|uniref:OadG family protein n=2 Tax=Oscillibacter TaxID=459786 RepID=UPI0021721415|nr:OadG family protein [Oscillibacter sp.]MCI8842218.1 OadG family protein [Oscillibacter sp.]MCI9113169.1 OadG family protein [Oscillibacter sp.]MCI9241601.1 OadG family protein [Oscillibacter sp.]